MKRSRNIIAWLFLALLFSMYAAAWAQTGHLVTMLWVLLIVSVIAAVARIPPVLERRRQRGRCPECGYDLRGNRDAGCPECGWRRLIARPAQAGSSP